MVNGVSFRAGKSLESARDIMNQPQTYARQEGAQGAPQSPEADTYVKPKSHKTRNAIIGGLVTAAVVIGGLVAGNKMGGFQKVMDWAGKEGAGAFKKGIGTAAEYANKWGGQIAELGVKGWNTVKGWLPGGGEKVS